MLFMKKLAFLKNPTLAGRPVSRDARKLVNALTREFLQDSGRMVAYPKVAPEVKSDEFKSNRRFRQ